ncbi:zinc-binding alcohol dehydrogenase family protein [Bacillus sp. FJAT-50079]|uniref:zinc-binding alcohol dehydrogenase family protein n=1 Tax=Bacillus sp. FJAT-50079 TaxID=2833577 RepID=UPI001BCA03E0|nr:zinc-binding alcohol dehydrogenase family protein [Bacillus sp. FJAT-50079]MBS4207990.1 zinc-binding alcohol dehydrogenase family protein [Bacillus sp. FJAT-50079]
MKSIVCVKPNEFAVKEIKAPILQPGRAIVRIKRIGICGTDLHAYRGNQPYFTYPRILGHELGGIVEEIGENADGIRSGDQVAIIPYLECGICIACRRGKTNCCTEMKVIGVHQDGGMREKISVPVKNLVKTAGLTLDEAAMAEPLAIGAHAVRRSFLTKRETILVIGAGPIGLGVMAFAKDQGANVIAMDINEERLGFCKSWAKVDATVNGLHKPLERLEELTNGDLPTIVFDATGNVKSMTKAFQYVAHGGSLVYVGLVKDEISFSDPEFHKKELTLLSSRNATREDFDYVLETLSAGEIDIDRYITHRCQFNEMIDQFEGWLLPESKVIKAIVEL